MIDRPVRRYVKTRFLQNRFSKVESRVLIVSLVDNINCLYFNCNFVQVAKVVDDLVKE